MISQCHYIYVTLDGERDGFSNRDADREDRTQGDWRRAEDRPVLESRSGVFSVHLFLIGLTGFYVACE